MNHTIYWVFLFSAICLPFAMWAMFIKRGSVKEHFISIVLGPDKKSFPGSIVFNGTKKRKVVVKKGERPTEAPVPRVDASQIAADAGLVAEPEQGSPEVVPEQGSTEAVPEQGSPEAVPEQGSPEVVPEQGSPEAVPEQGSPEAVPEKAHTATAAAEKQRNLQQIKDLMQAIPENIRRDVDIISPIYKLTTPPKTSKNPGTNRPSVLRTQAPVAPKQYVYTSTATPIETPWFETPIVKASSTKPPKKTILPAPPSISELLPEFNLTLRPISTPPPTVIPPDETIKIPPTVIPPEDTKKIPPTVIPPEDTKKIPPIGSKISQSLKTTILDIHNNYRLLHQAEPLVWDENLAASAQAYIDTCQEGHSDTYYGENLAFGLPSFPDAVEAWYNEVAIFDFSNPMSTEKTGHMTQMLWTDTKKIGCAENPTCTAHDTLKAYICRYDPPGNVIGIDWKPMVKGAL